MVPTEQEIDRAFAQMPDWRRHKLALALMDAAKELLEKRKEAAADDTKLHKPVVQILEREVA